MKKFKFPSIISISALIVFNVSCKKTEPDPEPDSNYPVADFTTNWKKGWGTVHADDFAGAVIDGIGNLYFTSASQPDGFAANVYVTKVNLSNQTVSWSISLDAGNQDYFPSPSENGHSQGGGGSRCIAIDNSGDVYISGTAKQGNNEVFVTKINASGQIVWQKFWKAANTGTVSSNAKAYALDVVNNKVFVTGTTGSGIGTEESNVFLLVLDAVNGNVSTNTRLGIDISTSYNDRGYTVKSPDGVTVYIAGWEGQSNSGFVSRLSMNGTTPEWHKRVSLGFGGRFTDIDLDATGNLYLAADYRGVSTFQGVVKMDNTGNVIWSKKFQGVANDRNNISCVRVINGNLYVGGRGSYEDYDEGQFGDGSLLKLDLNGNLIKQYNFFTGEFSQEKCGERIEGILPYNGGLILIGETWPEQTQIDGRWYKSNGALTSNSVAPTTINNPSEISGMGVSTLSSFSLNNYSQNLYDLSSGTLGSADVIIFSITE
jgi:hypothetical protein